MREFWGARVEWLLALLREYRDGGADYDWPEKIPYLYIYLPGSCGPSTTAPARADNTPAAKAFEGGHLRLYEKLAKAEGSALCQARTEKIGLSTAIRPRIWLALSRRAAGSHNSGF